MTKSDKDWLQIYLQQLYDAHSNFQHQLNQLAYQITKLSKVNEAVKEVFDKNEDT